MPTQQHQSSTSRRWGSAPPGATPEGSATPISTTTASSETAAAAAPSAKGLKKSRWGTATDSTPIATSDATGGLATPLMGGGVAGMTPMMSGSGGFGGVAVATPMMMTGGAVATPLGMTGETLRKRWIEWVVGIERFELTLIMCCCVVRVVDRCVLFELSVVVFCLSCYLL